MYLRDSGSPTPVEQIPVQPAALAQAREKALAPHALVADPGLAPHTVGLVPLDADHATLTAHLDASPDWKRTASTNNTFIYRHDGEDGTYRVFVPADDNPTYDGEDKVMCAEAAYSINAVTLGLPANTPNEAIRRLVEIVETTRRRDIAWPYPAMTTLYGIATGQDVTR
ncbi:hypothetical protein GCM10010404_81180 [Nonomuraea africana]|uniref:DUF317 domain-containing protein n=1 Tax=Nonomuraea africana TaxID=46171 RepID=A0ABR9KWV3_9ACTN|nr:hypothetical protein [Nonomuraea africana]MBE1566504.1 hypothetical protein [Nonomuraea africana]